MKIKLDSQDKSYVSRVKSRVENHNRQTFDVTDLNGQTVMLGSEGIVALALAMRETMTVAELLKMISDEPRPYNNKYVEVNPFPRFSKLKKKFKSRHWQYTNSRSTLMDTSLPYFGVKLSCVCLMFAYRKKLPVATLW